MSQVLGAPRLSALRRSSRLASARSEAFASWPSRVGEKSGLLGARGPNWQPASRSAGLAPEDMLMTTHVPVMNGIASLDGGTPKAATRSQQQARGAGGVHKHGGLRLHRHSPVAAHSLGGLFFLFLSDPVADLLFALTDRVRVCTCGAQVGGELVFRHVLPERRRFVENLLLLLPAVLPGLHTFLENTRS